MYGPPSFDFVEFYESYSHAVIARPGYPTRAAYKSFLAWSQFGSLLMSLAGDIDIVADVGGCFGFGLNSFLFHGSRRVGHEIRGDLYEVSEFYLEIGQRMFPHIHFTGEDFTGVELDQPYDVTLMFDLLEHVPDPSACVGAARERTRLLIILTPLETSSRREKRIARGKEPEIPVGEAHPEGHIHFFTLPAFLEMVGEHFEVCGVRILPPWKLGPEELCYPERPHIGAVVQAKKLRVLHKLKRAMLYSPPGRMLRDAAVRRGKCEGYALLLAKSRCQF